MREFFNWMGKWENVAKFYLAIAFVEFMIGAYGYAVFFATLYIALSVAAKLLDGKLDTYQIIANRHSIGMNLHPVQKYYSGPDRLAAIKRSDDLKVIETMGQFARFCVTHPGKISSFEQEYIDQNMDYFVNNYIVHVVDKGVLVSESKKGLSWR